MKEMDLRRDRMVKRLLACVVCLSSLAAFACSAPLSGVAGNERDAEEHVESGEASSVARTEIESKDMSEQWNKISTLIDEQKYREALESAEHLLADVQGGKDGESWARALIQVLQLETGLHGYETAVLRLREEPWPDDALSQTALNLYYAQGLTTYLQVYSWEIGQRERVVSGSEVDLEAWTGEQILAEAQRAFAAVWEQKDGLGSRKIGVLARYLEPNNYPRDIRETLRDAVTYMWVELLADSSRWQPRHHDELFRLDLPALIAPSTDDGDASHLDDPDVHPLEKVATLLADLESWHASEDRREAALEARLERLRRLRAAFPEADGVALIRAELERILETFDDGLAWWSVVAAELAEMLRLDADPWSLVAARDLALGGAERHPDSIGGRRCRHLVAAIEAPDYSVTAMGTDGVSRRSIEVGHKNLDRLHFRAYRVDLVRRIGSSQDYNLLPGRREIEKALEARAPAFSWSSELEPTPDYRHHRSFVTPDIDMPGLYLLVASARESFEEADNQLQALYLNLSDLVLLVRREPQAFEVTVRSGSTGAAVVGATVDLYRYDYSRRGHQRVKRMTTGRDGRVRFVGGRSDYNYFVVASLGDEIVFDPAGRSWPRTTKDKQRRRALVYTDRSVYRPGQEILWKVVAYRGQRAVGHFETLPAEAFSVELVDANGEVVESVEVESNDFGSTSGRFEIPPGRLLGSWRLRASLGGAASVLVEEYKRPTFEVELSEPEAALRLNREATLGGSVRYYFGLPVVDGEVRWRVTRVPVYPRWWSWWYPSPPDGREQTVASGTTSLEAEGEFSFTFLPAADERKAGSGVSFRYRASVEVTDSGGETRSVDDTFRLGFVTLEAAIESEQGFFEAEEPPSFSVRRTDLDGIARAGAGSWRLVVLDQPGETQLPADLPVPEPLSQESARPEYRTSGDRQRPRWSTASDPTLYLRSWEDGPEMVRGESLHGEDGEAEIRLPLLSAGAYRLYYSTEDPFGARYETQREFVVVVSGATDLALPVVLWSEQASVSVGEKARFLVHSGLADQQAVLEIFHRDELLERRILDSSSAPHLIELEVGSEHRGGIGARLTAVRDHQLLAASTSVFVPWDDRRLEVSFATFRDRMRPGDKERWRVIVKAADERAMTQGGAELLAYMYDRSLDLFAPHLPVDPGQLYPRGGRPSRVEVNLGPSHPQWRVGRLFSLPSYPQPHGDRLKFLSGYGIGGMGRRVMRMAMAGPVEMMAEDAVLPRSEAAHKATEGKGVEEEIIVTAEAEMESEAPSLRTDFSETAFWEPHLRLDDEDSVAFEFTVPDSLTEWSVWVHALTRDLKAGRLERRSVTSKELMVRPYLPRFLREGDRVEIQVAVNNAGDAELSGVLDLGLEDPVTGADVLGDFGLSSESVSGVPFRIAAGGGDTFAFTLKVPARLGEVAVRAEATAGEWSDGEVRSLPLLPGRMHLIQSRFAALQDVDRRELYFSDMAADDDSSLLHEQLVVTLEGQLFYGVLHALPYLASFPYECTEQTLNRFLSTGIVSTLYDRYPAVRRMAREFSERQTRLEVWELEDPNRAMALEETPWLMSARGGQDPSAGLINVLDPKIARSQRRSSLAKLEKAQTAIGGFPWWPGGPPSPYMTLYLLSGFSRALEFGIEVPKSMVANGWHYMHRHYVDEMARQLTDQGCCWELVTYLNYVLSSYPDESWTGGAFTPEDRQRMFEFSFKHWKRHSPLLKGYLALTLKRAGRTEDADLVFASVMDSALIDPDLGTYWAPEDRAWLWYNDTIESHAFALRALTELDPGDDRRHGLVHWLFLNKKLNHWKSTRATAEVIYALVHYLDYEATLGAREAVEVAIGSREPQTIVFEPDEYTGHNRQIVIAGDDVEATSDSTIVVEKETPGLLFASATWHFSTNELPEETRGDFFSVGRRYFKRVLEDEEWTLKPLVEGARLEPGDQVEVHLSIKAKHAAEYIHLRDPRPAGFEPETLTSGYSWKLGLPVYEEIRDSGSNFFFEWLPIGEYALKYRLRANLAGSFKAAPAQLQSMYAPEFAAYSAGDVLQVGD